MKGKEGWTTDAECNDLPLRRETLFRITRVVIARSIGSEMNEIESEEDGRMIWGEILHHHRRRRRRIEDPLISHSVARWQNLIPSFPWIVPGWGAQSKERKGSNFAA